MDWNRDIWTLGKSSNIYLPFSLQDFKLGWGPEKIWSYSCDCLACCTVHLLSSCWKYLGITSSAIALLDILIFLGLWGDRIAGASLLKMLLETFSRIEPLSMGLEKWFLNDENNESKLKCRLIWSVRGSACYVTFFDWKVAMKAESLRALG